MRFLGIFGTKEVISLDFLAEVCYNGEIGSIWREEISSIIPRRSGVFLTLNK